MNSHPVIIIYATSHYSSQAFLCYYFFITFSDNLYTLLFFLLVTFLFSLLSLTLSFCPFAVILNTYSYISLSLPLLPLSLFSLYQSFFYSLYIPLYSCLSFIFLLSYLALTLRIEHSSLKRLQVMTSHSLTLFSLNVFASSVVIYICPKPYLRIIRDLMTANYRRVA